MRIYHIGLPKTGTTSFQKSIQNSPFYIGLNRDNLVPTPHYNCILNHLRGDQKLRNDKSLPDKFIFSEELILAPARPNHLEEILTNLLGLLRPCDKVVITTRHPKDVLFSRYCERYRHLWSYTLQNAVLYHPLFSPYDFSSYKRIIPQTQLHQFEFIDYLSFLAGESISISECFGDYGVSEHINTRSRQSNLHEVWYRKRKLESITKAINNFLCHLIGTTKDPLRHIQMLNSNKEKSIRHIRKPIWPDEYSRVKKAHHNGLLWLKSNYGIDYLSQ